MQKMKLLKQNLDNVANGVFLLSKINEESKALQSASLIADSVTGIAKIVVNTQAANSAVALKYAAIPGGAAPSCC